MKPSAFVVALLLCLVVVSLSAQNKPEVKFKFGKGLVLTASDSSAQVKLNFRFQNLFNASRTLADDEIWEASFLPRRARAKMSGWAFSPKLGYKVELALSNLDLGSKYDFGETNEAPKIILDAVLKWQATKHWTIWMGQSKLPGNRERVISSQKMQMVDRSLVNSIFNIDREMSIQIRGKYKIGEGLLQPIFSWSLGEGRNITETSIGGAHYTYRLEWLPMGAFAGKGDYVGADLEREAKPKLALAATYSLINGAARQKQSGRFLIDEDGNYLSHDLQTVFVDMMFKYRGFSLMGEFAHKIVVDKEIRGRQDLRLDLLDADGRSYFTGTGYNLQAGYLFDKNIELSARYTTVVPDTEASFTGVDEYTLGVSKYFVGHALKIQSDISFLDENNTTADDLRYRLQVEFQL